MGEVETRTLVDDEREAQQKLIQRLILYELSFKVVAHCLGFRWSGPDDTDLLIESLKRLLGAMNSERGKP